MRSQIISQAFAMTTAAAAAALLLTACGPSQPQSQTTTAPGTGQASQLPTSSASTAPPASSAPATTPPESPAPGTTAAGAPALCKAAGLTAATDATGGGAAGSVYMKLNLTNKGTEPCVLKGFAGVSLVADAAGAPIGAPATRDDSAPVVDVLLAPGQTGTAVLRYTQAANYMDCSQVDAAGYRVYPPEDTDSLFLPQPTKACSNEQITLLSIGAFQPA
ncbi:DUF4232 domain-containing protein [Arthrobacter sp. SLBN-112]|uniref:DUF4232 domain-containing protein n=1 Tax=Arthrobacter sp. SLBN-112 TaxID=2768452 RepID=UPI0027AFB255|nr:DUF4232 domain-containing protein [Arthrobacter sp. SLBN-112]MDQ0798466.1 hypothetical protein [Arthrobacter sp. SLBN-112]